MRKSTAIVLIVMLVGLMIITLAILINSLFDLSLAQNITMGWILTLLYVIFALSITRGTTITPVKTRVREVVREVEKPVYIEEKKEKLIIPKYNYLASLQTKTYHKQNCRFGKLIKKKFKIQNDSEAFFKKNKYVPCKICIKKK